MALAQGTDLLLLDEPTTYLDVAHQVEMLDLLADLNHGRGTTVVMVLHDLNLSARYADHLVAMKSGRDRRRGRARRGRHRGDGARGVRPRQPGDHRPRLAHPAGRPGRTPPQPGPERDPTMTMTTNHSLPMILDEVEVMAVERISPTYVRVELGSPVLADFGVDGPLYDQRIKLVFPNDAGQPAVVRGRRRVVVRHLARDPGVRARPHAHLHRARRPRHRRGHPARRRLRPAPRGRRDRPGLGLGGAGDGRRPAGHDGAAARRVVRRHRVRRRARPSRCCWWPTRPPYRPCAASSRTCRHRPAARRSWRFPSRAT